jgi:hypothetical protein
MRGSKRVRRSTSDKRDSEAAMDGAVAPDSVENLDHGCGREF